MTCSLSTASLQTPELPLSRRRSPLPSARSSALSVDGFRTPLSFFHNGVPGFSFQCLPDLVLVLIPLLLPILRTSFPCPFSAFLVGSKRQRTGISLFPFLRFYPLIFCSPLFFSRYLSSDGGAQSDFFFLVRIHEYLFRLAQRSPLAWV